MARPPRVSPDRILAAAAAEFAARGFAGARVDRIARSARVNKAMLYYHFHNKKTLYRTVLRQMFAAAAARLGGIAAADLPAPEKLERIIAAIAAHITEHAMMPNIMLREIAEGGAHLDRETLAALAAIPRAVAGVVAQGVADGAFRDVHPIFAYFSILAPIVVYLGGTPIRREMADLQLMDAQQLDPDLFIRHLQDTMRRALAPDKRSRS
jgi:AcrR family transcriptional regulator